ncbi:MULTISPECIES: diacylglycerol kinase [Serratia]|jgi:diacylglycerol kinase (ATP)|uniref:Diacylglycerol kinase n=2 Tax=Serratia marcescens TaxID=615 RepID=V5YUV6_SERMA|nr:MULTISPECIES: diacylglycerol kinase [Serratia]MBM1297885.1 diacylglycerol kinase [Serratia nematodiphila]ASM18699.1 diacylglycerol kinase [Serratia marcescens]AWO81087.1 diacylglycerol kinase [Serratia marcescens]AXK26239.1 Diacylglycerol kinase [Serratia marcescens]EGT0453610.1 diacylglycerol kinase [Serratia marcescens]
MANQATGLTRIIKAAGYSYKGLSAAWQHEAAFRQELVVTLLAIILAVWLDVGAIARILLIGSVALVMIVEILNSAIEAVVDRIGSEHHELSGRAKDMGSAAVSLAIALALFVWGTVLWQHFG